MCSLVTRDDALWRRLRLACLALGLLFFAGASAQADADKKLLAITRTTIYPGEVIDDGMLADSKPGRPTDSLGQPLAAREEVLGKIARRTLLAGQPIVLNSIRLPYAVRSGKPVSLLFKSGTLTITGQGLALQNGAVGDTLPVQNTDSGLIIRGRVASDGLVEIGE